ncbi:aldo/keto reductase [Granulosicoccus sp. 3-233]|uniref:aldo/keto reductase n=1 Tax=Granulosicoccus sp. 3-233 TaxID=3417969 RepID=UPI003D33BEAB
MINSRTKVGKSTLNIPALCFGTSGLGDMPATYGYSTPEERAFDTIRHILDSDFPFLDSSRNYGDGRSEERIGKVIAQLGGLPEGALLSTKLDRDMQTGKFDAARARESLEQSLKAMNVDQVDLLHLHDPEHAASLDEVSASDGPLAELMKMKEEGLCKAVGLAAGKVDIMMPLLRNWDFDALITHNRFTLVNRNAEAMIELARSRDISVLNAAPYAGGVLAKGTTEHPRYVYQEASDSMLDPVRHIETLCARHEVPVGAAALQFSMRDPRIAATICGVTRPERVEQTLAWATTEIPEALWQELDALTPSSDDPEASRVYKPG